jgi:predicted site-specific integrase-resolvase
MSEIVVMTQEQLAEFGKNLLEGFIKSMPPITAVPDKDIISPEELCKRLNISIPTQIRYRKKGKLPWLEIGNQIRYDWNEVLEKLKK